MEVDYQVILDASYDAGLEETAIRCDYSGRGMYGDTCLGIVGDTSDILKFAVALAEADEDTSWLGRCSTDNMGMSTIFYWSGVIVTDAPEPDEEE